MNWTDWIMATSFSTWVILALTLALVVFTCFAWLTYAKIAQLTERQNWLSGMTESHSMLQLMMRAHELGIPVLWWDPTRERWDPNAEPRHPGRRHRQVAQVPFVLLYVPEDERVGKDRTDKAKAPLAKPLTNKEWRAIEEERRRLARTKGRAK